MIHVFVNLNIKSNYYKLSISSQYLQSHMQAQSKVDKSNALNVFETKLIKRDSANKISAADVFNEFLYIGDDKGNIYSYPIRANDPQIIAKSTNEQFKNISKYKIDKLQCYGAISSVFALSDEKLYVIDSALRKPEPIATKVHDFAINQFSGKDAKDKDSVIHSIAVVSKKKQGYIIFLNPQTKKFEESKKFALNELPVNIGFCGSHIICSYKKNYESYNVQKNFALAKGFIETKAPFFKVTGSNEVIFFMDDIGLFMSPEFQPKQKDNITLTNGKPVLQIANTGTYSLILCEGILQIYSTYDQKRFTFVQEIILSPLIRGITSNRPFIFGNNQLQFLFEIPYQIQIKSLLERCRVDEALALLIQNIGPDNQQKIQQLKINAVWPLIRKMQFQKAKQILKTVNFDIRQLVLLYPELASLDIESLKNVRPQKYLNTLIIEFINQKATKGKDDQTDLKKKSKYFLKDILDYKRQYYLSRSNMFKVKIQFNTSKNSLIKQKLNQATPQQLLQIIDFYIIRWFLDMSMFNQLQAFFTNNPNIYCKRMFSEFQTIIKNNAKLVDFPTLKPRFFAAFERSEEAYQSWKIVAESNQKEALINMACEQSVKLLTQFQDKREVYKKLLWILKKRPEIGMSFFSKVDINFIQPDEVIRNFQQDKNEKYLQLYLETIVFEKKTQIQTYHTKLLLLYLEGIFKIQPKQSKQEAKTQEFAEKITKMRKLLRSPQAKYASQPILKKIEKCEWLLQDQIYLYSREKRHEQALKKYLNKNMTAQAEQYCKANRDGTLTIYFKLQLAMYKSYEASKNNTHILLKKDIITLLKKYASDPQLDSITVLEMIPDTWLLSDVESGIYQFLESAIIHTLHQKRATYTSKHLSEMDLLNVEYNLIQAKRAYLRFTFKKKCCICDTPISDKYFVVYPNANVCHQACVKKEKNTVCPVTKQDFQKTFKY